MAHVLKNMQTNMCILNHFQNSYFSEYFHLWASYVRVIGSLPDRTK